MSNSSRFKSPSVPPGTMYFSAADRQAESLIYPDLWRDAFESSLLNNILFQEHIAIPDVFLFISRGLAEHVGDAMRKGAWSLLDVAVKSGVIVTPFRDSNCDTYEDAYHVIRDSGIQGLLSDEVCQRILSRLDIAASDGRNAGTYVSSYWPSHNLGLKFEQRLASFFNPDGEPELDLPPVDDPFVAQLWQQT